MKLTCNCSYTISSSVNPIGGNIEKVFIVVTFDNLIVEKHEGSRSPTAEVLVHEPEDEECEGYQTLSPPPPDHHRQLWEHGVSGVSICVCVLIWK